MIRLSMQQSALRRLLGCAAVSASLVTAAGAQAPAPGAQRVGEGSWRISATAGGFAPRSAAIASEATGLETTLESGPALSLDIQYVASKSLSVYASGTGAFSRLSLGSAIAPVAVGPSRSATVLAGTGGLVLTAPGSAFGNHFQPILRIGGGFKAYQFNLAGADSQLRPTGDFGIGFRGVGSGPIEISAELRYMPSTFDQGKLPTRGITPQAQRQTDLLFGVGVSIRP
ncbi:MAG: hypothetical protein MUE41_01660 [Gemmatimonadaceae bacterium]|jgi:hypothetical protein|nr:hypothetical protein [Gemmatimonadaceae bacterium]